MIALVRGVICALDARRVDVPGERIGIDQHRRRAGIADGRDRRDEGHGGRDHLVAWPDTEREQREMQRGGAGIQRHGFPGAGKGGEGLLEGIDLRTGDVGAARQRLEHRGVEFRLDAGVLGAKIKQRNHEAILAGEISIGWPRWRSESMAASSVSTTARPQRPDVIGSRPWVTQSTKCSISVSSASFTESCGAHMSPLR